MARFSSRTETVAIDPIRSLAKRNFALQRAPDRSPIIRYAVTL
jgi:hypothetical protein